MCLKYVTEYIERVYAGYQMLTSQAQIKGKVCGMSLSENFPVSVHPVDQWGVGSLQHVKAPFAGISTPK